MMILRNGAPLPEALREIRLQLEVVALNQRPDAKAVTLQLVGLLLQAEGVARAQIKPIAAAREPALAD